MTTLESSLSTTFLVVTFIVIMLVGGGFLLRNAALKHENMVIDQDIQLTDTALQSLLKLNDPISQAETQMMLETYFFTKEKEIEIAGERYVIRDNMERMFSKFMGNGKYYFKASPIVNDLNLHFIIDGSATMSDIRDGLATRLPTFIDDLELNSQFKNVDAQIYILSETGSNLCDVFPVTLPCEYLNGNKLYLTHDDLPSPFDKTLLTSVDSTFYSESDWATAAGVVSREIHVVSPNRLDLIIPIADEVALGSKDDSCMYLDVVYLTDYYGLVWCINCKAKTDFSKSNMVVDRVIPILKENKHYFCGVTAITPSFTESSTFKDYMDAYYPMIGQSKPGNRIYCGYTQCAGCVDASYCQAHTSCLDPDNCRGCPTAPAGKAYWHPEGKPILDTQFLKLASATDGGNYPLDDLDGMLAFIVTKANAIVAGSGVEFGIDNPSARTISVRKILPITLATGAYMDMKIEQYPEIAPKPENDDPKLISYSINPDSLAVGTPFTYKARFTSTALPDSVSLWIVNNGIRQSEFPLSKVGEEVDPYSGNPMYTYKTADNAASITLNNDLLELEVVISGVAYPFTHLITTDHVSGGTAQVAIIAIKSKLNGKYSPAELTEIENKAKALAATIKVKEGLTAQFMYIDQPEIKVYTGKDAQNMDDTGIKQTLKDLQAASGTEYVIIIGGDSSFPFSTAIVTDTNGASKTIKTDDPFADTDGDKLVDLMIGRMPDPINADASVLKNQLDTANNLHIQGGLIISEPTFHFRGSSSNMPNCFIDSYYSSAHTCDDSIIDCRDNGEFNCNLESSDGKKLYFLYSSATGANELACASGSTCCMPAITNKIVPSSVANVNVDGAIWMVLAPFSADAGVNSASGSIPLTFLSNNGGAYLGIIGEYVEKGWPSSYSCTNSPRGGDGLMGTLMLVTMEKMKTGVRIGGAVRLGKRAYQNGIYASQSPKPEAKEFVVNSLTFYGDPTLQLKVT